MSLVGQKVLTQRNRIVQPQYSIEGITPATFAVVATNPTLKVFGNNVILIDNSAPVTQDKNTAGNYDKLGKTKLAELNTVTIQYQFTKSENDSELVEWALASIPVGDAATVYKNFTPDESRAFFDSYENSAGVQIFRQFLGCKPQSITITVNRTTVLTVEIICSCKSILEDSTGPTLGTSSFATANTAALYTQKDGGGIAISLSGVQIGVSTWSITASITQVQEDAIGFERTLYSVPSKRVVTGSLSIYKKDEALQAAAKAVTASGALVVTLDSITATKKVITIPAVLFLPSNEPIDGDSADGIIETKSIEANNGGIDYVSAASGGLATVVVVGDTVTGATPITSGGRKYIDNQKVRLVGVTSGKFSATALVNGVVALTGAVEALDGFVDIATSGYTNGEGVALIPTD